ncbi:MAG: triose-phosphate isomerase [Acidimicrobiia bacterium]
MDLIMGNWKMHATHLEAIQMMQKLFYRLNPDDYARVEVVVAPPFTSLRSVQTVIESDKMPIGLGAQNVHWESEGAFTGEVSPGMLAKLSVSYVIVGHSERRAMFGDTDEVVNRKAKAVLAAEMRPVVCVGESLEQREAGEALEVVAGQLAGSLAGISIDDPDQIVVAYEPVWAIGTGRSATPDDAAEVTDAIRADLVDRWGEAGEGVRILYGGSVNQGNIAGFMAKRTIDGALVGGASLDPDKFAGVIRYWI